MSRDSTEALTTDRFSFVDKLCDRLRTAWRAGNRLRIEELLEQTPESLRDFALEELIVEEAELRAQAGEEPRFGDYEDRFRNRREAAFRGFRHFSPQAPIPEDLVAQLPSLGPLSRRTPGRAASGNEQDIRPDRCGEYEVLEKLGSGTFGIVYKARHCTTGSLAAVKVLKSKWAKIPEQREQFLVEARRTDHVDHPRVIRALEVAEQADPPYFVQQYVDGWSLDEFARLQPPTYRRAAELVEQIADALTAIHQQALYHRDLKPANILVDRQGQVYVADFGLALEFAERWRQRGVRAGTLLYMSPEQLQGETHLLGARSDLWGLGVIFYWLLTRRLPFESGSKQDAASQQHRELIEEIHHRTPRAPREIDPAIPRPIQRLCMYCLCKEIERRPPSAADFRDDLREELARLTAEDANLNVSAANGTNTTAATAPVYPKPSLYRFTAEQSELYLRLMPTSYGNREELPEVIAYWKQRIDATAKDVACRVGLLVGVSGCGKSSLLEAGLLPRLAAHVHSVVVQASEEETELQLLKELGARFAQADISREWTLPDWLVHLRDSDLLPDGQKVLLVLDQFEQWLHAHGGETTSQLVSALRQCDGSRVQALVCVREGFHSSMMRFFEALDVRLDEQRNYATAHRFTAQHASFVLEQFGLGLGKLSTPPTTEQQQFLHQAIEGLTESDRGVVCVRLVVLALVMAERAWIPAELESLGGLNGIGTRFLWESFEGRTAPEEYRLLLPHALRVMHCLLPPGGLEIKHSQSYRELRQMAGPNTRPDEFDRLLEILTRRLFLLTPIEPVGGRLAEPAETTFGASESTRSELSPPSDTKHDRHYQLTHDFLVPSVRQWIELKEGQSPDGRARLLLRRLANAWSAEPSRRYLPSLVEYLTIRRRTTRKTWTTPQREMMRRASAAHGVNAILAIAVFVVLVAAAIGIRTDSLIRSLRNADIAQVPSIVDGLRHFPRTSAWLLRWHALHIETDSPERLKLSLALLESDSGQLEYLIGQLLAADAVTFPVIQTFLAVHKDDLLQRLWTELLTTRAGGRQLNAAAALAAYAPDDTRWENVRDRVAFQLATVNAAFLGDWQEAFRPVSEQLIKPLSDIYRDEETDPLARSLATALLADYASQDVSILVELIVDADPKQFASIYPVVIRHGATARSELESAIDRSPSPDASEDAKEKYASRAANAAVALLHWGMTDKVWSLLRYRPDPRVRAQLIWRMGQFGVSPRLLADQLERETAAGDKSIRRALLLSLGSFDVSQIDESYEAQLIDQLARLFCDDNDPGVHSAAEWVLRRWNQEDRITEARASLRRRAGDLPRDIDGKNWYINGQGQTFAIIDAGEFTMGSPLSEAGREQDETLHARRINRRFAVGTTEVTRGQWRRFADVSQVTADHPTVVQFSPRDDCPMIGVSWYDATSYCNRLSEEEGIDSAQWCYVPTILGDYGPGMKAKANHLELTGYRLLTEAEWEYASRANAATCRSFGASNELLPEYAWFVQSSAETTNPVGVLKPNDFGLFDSLGNASEWCFDPFHDPRRKEFLAGNQAVAIPYEPPNDPIQNNVTRVLRGAAFDDRASNVRCAERFENRPNYRGFNIGFRLARTLPRK